MTQIYIIEYTQLINGISFRIRCITRIRSNLIFEYLILPRLYEGIFDVIL